MVGRLAFPFLGEFGAGIVLDARIPPDDTARQSWTRPGAALDEPVGVSRIWRAGPPIRRFTRQQGTDEADDCIVVGENAEDVGPALDLAVDTSIGLIECGLARCSFGNDMHASLSASAYHRGEH